MADVFGVDTDTVSDHIKNFLDNGELDLGATTGKFPVVQIEGGREVRREINHFALDVALYVGYRVNSAQGVTFRRYVTDVLIQIAKHGYYIDKERLMQPGRGFGDVTYANTCASGAVNGSTFALTAVHFRLPDVT